MSAMRDGFVVNRPYVQCVVSIDFISGLMASDR